MTNRSAIGCQKKVNSMNGALSNSVSVHDLTRRGLIVTIQLHCTLQNVHIPVADPEKKGEGVQ